MNSFHAMWLFVALHLTFIGNSFCLDCQYTAVPSKITVTSTLNGYGKENINNLSDTPWVGVNSPDVVSLSFPNQILLTKLEMKGGDVDLYSNGTLVKCYVTRFWLHYTNETGRWYKYSPEFKSGGNESHDKTVDIKYPITSINITIKKYVGCPAVNLRLTACGVCTEPSAGKGQSLNCTDDLQQCSYTCKTGFTSNHENNVGMCQLDGSWSESDLQCVDVNECTNNANICGDRANCTNIDGSYKCDCHNGFTGNPPSSRCEDIDECANKELHMCHRTLGVCKNNMGSYNCECRKGYDGDGRTCTDIDECHTNQHNCHTNATCVNTIGSFKCHCNPLLSGDGTDCYNFDECGEQTDDCHANASCMNTLGSFECTCKSGFSGNGVNCTNLDECSAGNNDCHENAYCTDTIGSFTCSCKEGYTGNGTSCVGSPVRTTINPDKALSCYGERLEMYCNATGSPEPSIKWEKGNTFLSYYHTLVIESVQMDDDGTYTCTGSNKDTIDIKKINVTVIETPTVVEIIEEDTQASGTSVQVFWHKPDRGASAITQYTVDCRNCKGEKSFETSNLFFEIKDLDSNTEYYILVVAKNSQGCGDKGDYVKVTTLAPKPQTLPQSETTRTPTSSSVSILVKKLNSQYETKLQVIVRKVSPRRKRNTADCPNEISNYTKADCEGTSGCCYITAQLENKEVDFTIGDDEVYGGYKNAKLEPTTTYNIYVRGLSFNDMKKVNFGDLSKPLKISTAEVSGNSDGENGSVVGIAVGLTVLLLVLIVLVVVVIIYVKSRRPKAMEIDPETGEEKGRNSELLLTKKQHGKRKSGQVEDGQPDPHHPPVSTSGFAKYVGKLHKSDDRGFMIQYNTLETSRTYTSDFATSPENKEKNRYANIVAYDVSRVNLKQIDDDDNSSYINASFVDGYNSANAYIATQGPLPETFNDFWRMIWEKNCSAIVMLTNLQERHKLKCHKYWPEESETYGQITVTATRKEQYADYVIRTFLLVMKETEEEREMKQFHFTVWPDHGVPEYPTAILAFQRRVRAYSARDSGPLAVHCSAGVGRSGTFIVIDCMLARIQSEQAIDIYNYVRYLRTRRMYMVQTEEQYVFTHDALLESILCGNTQMAAHNLRIEMNKLRQGDATTKLTGFESEFKTLNKVSPSLPKESFVVATYPENASKNRYPDILASDHGRVALSKDDDDKEDGPYINAVYLDGYKQQNAFIVTQTPMKETVTDFWQMLYEKHSACVILLTNLTLEEGDFPRFWPEEGCEKYSTFNVELVSDVSKGDTGSEDQFQQEKLTGDIIERKLKLTKEEDKSLVVKMFQHLSWSETSVPTDISAFISLIQRIEKWQQHSGNGPITIVCNDGQGRSGTFAALCSVLERVKTEQVVDVFQTIKALRIQRPGLVKDVDQYQFIHFGVQEYLDSFADYANFK